MTFMIHDSLRAALEEHGLAIVPKELTREIGEAMMAAMWPDGEIIYSDAFSGPEAMLSAGHAAMIAIAR